MSKRKKKRKIPCSRFLQILESYGCAVVVDDLSLTLFKKQGYFVEKDKVVDYIYHKDYYLASNVEKYKSDD